MNHERVGEPRQRGQKKSAPLTSIFGSQDSARGCAAVCFTVGSYCWAYPLKALRFEHDAECTLAGSDLSVGEPGDETQSGLSGPHGNIIKPEVVVVAAPLFTKPRRI